MNPPDSPTTPAPRSGPLHGLRILDMATVVAAPFASALCADLGAEVVKLELPDGSDVQSLRRFVRQRLLPFDHPVSEQDLASGEPTGAFALTEPDAGSDAPALRTSARRDKQRIHLAALCIGPAIRMLDDELSPGNVLIRVAYSSINDKDALAAAGRNQIIAAYPRTGGIDFSGTVVESGDARLAAGDAVVVHGLGIGVDHDGGHAQMARVPADWVLPVPAGLSLLRGRNCWAS